MAVLSTSTAIRYAGNNSTSDRYTIPFPFFDPGDIYLAITAADEEEPELQAPGSYTVVRNPNGTPGGELTTASPVPSTSELVIFRVLPLTQPSVFPVSGPFPAQASETALDRLLMQIQQLATRVGDLEGDNNSGIIPVGAGALEVPTWANGAERETITPARIGQLGVERDTQSLWIAQSVTEGDWSPISGRSSERLVLGLVADGGEGNAAAIASALGDWEVNAVLFSGDNNHSGASNYEADWAPFASYIASGKAYPALGNRDMDEEGWEARHSSKFDYLPDTKRYYHVTLGDGLVDLFVLNSGLDSTFDVVEPSGNDTESAQYEWFLEALEQSRARWRIAMFHHPPATISDNTDGVIEPAMAWPELARMDLICCGHAHVLELLRWSGTQILSVSPPVIAGGSAAVDLQGGEETDGALWADDVHTGLARIVASQEKLSIEVWAVGVPYLGRRLLHSRDARDLSIPQAITETFTLCKGSFSASTLYVYTMPFAGWLEEVVVSTFEADDELAWTLRGGSEILATGTAETGELRSVSSATLAEMIPAGTLITLQVEMDAPRVGLEVTLRIRRHG